MLLFRDRTGLGAVSRRIIGVERPRDPRHPSRRRYRRSETPSGPTPIATFQNNSMEQSGYEVGGLLRIRRELVDLVSGDQVTRR